MDKEKQLLQCYKYFKDNKGFHRPLLKIRGKYRSLGKIGGTIVLRKLREEEKEALTGFLGKNYYKENTSIKVDKFEKALLNTPFKDISLKELLGKYFYEDIISKNEEKNLYEHDRKEFFNNIMEKFKDTKGSNWLNYVLSSKKNAYMILVKAYDGDRERLKKHLKTIIEGINSLPYENGKIERLALWSSQISKNPHTFDGNNICGKLLIHGVVYILNKTYPKNAEERAELLYDVGIINDEVSNFTMGYGLRAMTKGEYHLGWDGFYKSGEPLIISLFNLSKIDRVISKNNKVFVVENPTVFIELIDRVKDRDVSFICTYGQLRLASILILDKIYKEKATIYYSGDFDPEGIQIADRLKKRYKDNLILWNFNEEYYLKALSKNRIDHKRMKKLEKVEDEKLRMLGNIIKEYGVGAYQEGIIDDLIKSIETLSLL
ncbi:MAG: TIGR02679 family protein [Anaeromicrobium sp.]|jgi:uncharacterized protein (TIGR02679 family)|uniref:TIGR02679 family protein n=1 Tax=Anaeromicrobium sp. TaxID=1929132 RepID=UPI0025FE5FBC|nr:TIGR02679 family protein [Anaeromicrobium sp.]MCT4594236.1 TIGR02679 family protein [Anaeromicrobium sp.]